MYTYIIIYMFVMKFNLHTYYAYVCISLCMYVNVYVYMLHGHFNKLRLIQYVGLNMRIGLK